MAYPPWDVPYIGGGLVIAIVATLHVIIAHFAVGAGLLVACLDSGLAGHAGTEASRADVNDFLRRFGRVIILVSFVAGVLSGVGIWFSVSLASPRATSILIHHFLWGWAAEWVLFVVEVASGYIYYYGFDTLPASRRRVVAWIYAGTAWGSLFVVNGILSFMLSPGRWIETHDFWDGFFNPTFWPSLALRTVLSLGLAGAVALIIVRGSWKARGFGEAARRRISSYASIFVATLVLIIPFSIFYLGACPEAAQHLALGDAMRLTRTYLVVAGLASAAGVYALWAMRYGDGGRFAYDLAPALAMLVIALAATASLELVREGIRKPYLVYDYLYSSGWMTAEADPKEARALETHGVLALDPWLAPHGSGEGSGVALDFSRLSSAQRGHAVYRAQCAACHNLGGVNDLAPIVRGWSRVRASDMLAHLHERKFFMPPFAGNSEEQAALADYVWELGTQSLAAGEAGSLQRE